MTERLGGKPFRKEGGDVRDGDMGKGAGAERRPYQQQLPRKNVLLGWCEKKTQRAGSKAPSESQ